MQHPARSMDTRVKFKYFNNALRISNKGEWNDKETHLKAALYSNRSSKSEGNREYRSRNGEILGLTYERYSLLEAIRSLH